MIWFLIVALALLVGLTPLPRWTVAVFPAVAILLGLLVTGREPAAYDMHGASAVIGLVVATVSVVAWCTGRFVARVIGISRKRDSG